jgi:ubiquinone/menaquinone biosynthesis C-methylase UbiE
MYETLEEKETQTQYILGHSEEELRRLESQSLFFNDLTEQVFKRAGIGPGMQVVDVGCGAGDVSFLVAGLVGPQGMVIGVDKSAEAVTAARGRALKLGIRNVTFINADIGEIVVAQPVDALVGRLTLMYMTDPVESLKSMAECVKPGGVIVFQEIDALGYRTTPQCLSINQSAYWITETLRRSGADIQMGLRLYQTFLKAGLPAPQMIMGARVEAGADSQAYDYMAEIVRTLLPMIERFGVAETEQVQIETLAQRMREEALANESVVIIPPLIGAWATKP